ncbi:hypothetical protein L3X38_034908 [Prunus dulcis]|uniref:Uncharacterized protein n=1 Tax=Prunus dulcis TaxID=3755 RepID=A0AAD4VK60_PRUDU|nr:hypothetical protein L3X38_034908 [Prunus dulcis]
MVSEYNQFAAVGDKRKHDQISSPSHGKEGKKPGDPPTPEKTNLEGRTSNQRRRDETKNKLETGSETDSIKATLVLHEDLKQLSEIIHTIEEGLSILYEEQELLKVTDSKPQE